MKNPENPSIAIEQKMKKGHAAVLNRITGRRKWSGKASKEKNAMVLVLMLWVIWACSIDSSKSEVKLDTADHSSQEHFERIRELSSSGETILSDSAIKLLDHYMEKWPDDREALYLLGEMHLDRGVRFALGLPAFEAADRVANALIPLDPARGYEILGRSFMWRGEHSFAMDAFEQGIAKSPEDANIRAHLAWRHFQTGEHHRGIPEAIGAIRLDSTSGLAQEIFGFSLFHIDRPDLGREAFEMSLQYEDDSEGHGGFHLQDLSRGDYEAAVAYAEKLIKEQPDFIQAYGFAGHAHYFAGNDDQAIAYLEKAISLNPNMGVQYTGRSATTPLAYLYIKQGRINDAEKMLEHALSRADRRMYFGFEPWNSHYQYAGIALMRGNRDEALRWLQTALIGGMPGPVLLEKDRIYGELQGDPKFEEILERLKKRRDEIHRRLELELL